MSDPTLSAPEPAKGKAWLAGHVRAARALTYRATAAGLLSAAAGIGLALCIANLLVLHGPPDARLIAAFVVLAALRIGGLVWSERVAVDAGALARRRIRTEAASHLLADGPRLLRQSASGELVAVLIDRIEALDGLFARWLPAATLAVAAPALVALIAGSADPISGAVLLGAGLLVPVGMAAAGIGAKAASERQFVAMSRLQSRFLDRVRGIATIVLAGRAEDEARRLAIGADELRRGTMRVLRVAFLSSAALDCAFAAAVVVLATRFGSQALRGAGHPRTALFVLLLIPEFFAPLRSFAAAYQDRLQASGAADSLAGLSPILLPASPDAPIRTVAARGVELAFDRVSVTLDPARGPILQDLSFRVPPGETLVLSGPSGAGKSTVIEMLLGFLPLDTGRITLNGADLASIVPQALARMTAWIGQHPVLFAGTLRDNIRFGRPEATEDEIESAARSARVLAFSENLPLGLDTPVGEGGHGLSGGQAQRVAIARAFLKNAPLLLLDEPTVHLDPVTEGDVLDSLRRLTLGRTVVLATHSTAAHAFIGRRLELRDGRAVPARAA